MRLGELSQQISDAGLDQVSRQFCAGVHRDSASEAGDEPGLAALETQAAYTMNIEEAAR